MQQTASLFHIFVLFAIILGAFFSYVLERVPLAVTSLAVIVALLLFFYFFPLATPEGVYLVDTQTLLQGFSNPALITVMALLVIGQGMFQTDALDGISQRIAKLSGAKALILLFATATVSSAFINNTPVVVIFLPVVTALAHKLRMSLSKLALPLSYFSILGGMTTLIGSSTNLLVAGLSSAAGGPEIGFFSQTPLGVMLAVIGAVYIGIIALRFIPNRQSIGEQLTNAGGKQFIAEVAIKEGQSLVGAQARSGMFEKLKDMTVLLIRRGNRTFLPPFENVTLLPRDTVIIAATRSAISRLFSELGIKDAITTSQKSLTGDANNEAKEMGELTLAEVLVAPGSRYIGQTVKQAAIDETTHCSVIGVQRQNRMARQGFAGIRLSAGDVLLLLGSGRSIFDLRPNHDLVLLEWSASVLLQRRKAWVAQLIFGLVVFLASMSLVPMVIAVMGGALAMIVTGCLNIRQAARAFDSNILLLIVAAIGIAVPLEASGGAAIIASYMISWLASAPPWMLLSGFFLIVAIITNFLSNNAAAILFTPIALNIAAKTGISAEAFIMAVIFGANCSFATPIGYQTNLLVMGPGSYRFTDFIRIGVPLVLLMWLSFTVLAMWYYDL